MTLSQKVSATTAMRDPVARQESLSTDAALRQSTWPWTRCSCRRNRPLASLPISQPDLRLKAA